MNHHVGGQLLLRSQNLPDLPADDKENARLIVSRVVLDMLAGLKLAYPKVGARRKRELATLRRMFK